MTHDGPSVSWVRIWVGLGVAAALASLLIPLSILSNIRKEMIRKSECLQGMREDCDRSFIWALDEALQNRTGSYALLEDREDEGAWRYTSTSERAPKVTDVTIQGWESDGVSYRLPAGQLSIDAFVDGAADRVDVLYIPSDTQTPGVGRKIGELKKSGGSYRGEIGLEADWSGEIEIRAVAGGHYGSAVFRFAVE